MEKEEIQEANNNNVEAARQPELGLKPTITQEHHDYLMKRHGTTDLHPLPSMDLKDPYNWPSWKVWQPSD